MEDKSRIIVLESHSTDYDCCMHNKNCSGARCMSWRWQMEVPVGEVEYKLQGPHCPSIKTHRSAYGFCGMVK